MTTPQGHWPECGDYGWTIEKHPGKEMTVHCSGPCRCPWIIGEADSVVFTLPRPKVAEPCPGWCADGDCNLEGVTDDHPSS